MNSREHPPEPPTAAGIGKRLAALAGIVPLGRTPGTLFAEEQ